MQVDPIKPKSKRPGNQRLKLKCDILLSTSAFRFNLRHYSKEQHIQAFPTLRVYRAGSLHPKSAVPPAAPQEAGGAVDNTHSTDVERPPPPPPPAPCVCMGVHAQGKERRVNVYEEAPSFRHGSRDILERSHAPTLAERLH